MTDARRDVAERLEKLYRQGRRLERIGDTLYVLDGPDEHDWTTLTVQEVSALLRSEGREPRRPTDAEIDNACQNYRHDYFLLENEEQEAVRAEALEWLRSWIKVRESCPGWDSRRTPSDSPAGGDGRDCPLAKGARIYKNEGGRLTPSDSPAGEP